MAGSRARLAPNDLPPQVLAPDRLAAVRASGLLDSAASKSFDQLATLAARLLRAPMAFVTVVDDRRSYWVSCVGVVAEADAERHTAVQESFCQYVVADGGPLIVDDTAANARTRHNPSVRSMGVRAWAGFPLRDAREHTLGSLCVVDTAPRHWTEEDVGLLEILAEAASAQVALVSLIEAERAARDDATRMRVAERRAEERLERLAATALELVAAESVDDLTRVVGGVLPVLGAGGCAMVVRHDGTVLHLVVGDSLGPHVALSYAELPVDSALPAPCAARTGDAVLLGTRAAGLAFTPEMAAVYEATRQDAWACLPLRVGAAVLGSLAVGWREERTFDEAEVTLLESIAAQCAQALDRIQRDEARREGALAVQRLSEALQRSLLTRPPTPDSLQIAVSYQPAAREAEVGGDWYDAFVTAAGATVLVIGDVTGHDRLAAATMGQIRNVLRGMAYDSDDGPAELLCRLDRALEGLEVDTLVTCVIARVEQCAADRARGVRQLRWSNAGHLPPMLRQPDGTVEILDHRPDLLLGLAPASGRVEGVVELFNGSTLLLYTDGLVERRHESLNDGIARLAEVFAHTPPRDPQGVCDALLEAAIAEDGEDDIAMLVLRCAPQDGGGEDWRVRCASRTRRRAGKH